MNRLAGKDQMMAKRTTRVAAALAILLVAGSGAADARRGGSFGSRGSRTFSAPRSTRLAPGYVPGLSRTMTPRADYGSRRYAPSFPASGASSRRGGFGFGSGLLAGVVTGGLLGAMFGHHGVAGGYGTGGGGLLALLIQLALLGGAVLLVLRMIRGRSNAVSQPQQHSYATSVPGLPPAYGHTDGEGLAVPSSGAALTIEAADQRAFEDLLVELQDAFSREDYGRLRAITTPELMSYLAEELGENAAHGRRNSVSQTTLLDGEVSEAWREADADYATIAMRYESIDVIRDRASGVVTEGDATRPTQTTELWTFVRGYGPWGAWKVSAIQET